MSTYIKETISDLDEIVSKLKISCREVNNLDSIEKETIRHHAKDMIGAGTHYLLKLGESDDVKQMIEVMKNELKRKGIE